MLSQNYRCFIVRNILTRKGFVRAIKGVVRAGRVVTKAEKGLLRV